MSPGSVTHRLFGAWLFAAGVAAAGFVAVAVVVVSGLGQRFDEWGLLAMRDPADHAVAYGPLWLQETARDATALGSNGVLITLVLMGAGLLGLGVGRRPALYLLASFWGALALDTVAKHIVGRPRPTLVRQLAATFTTSFPSSHATVSSAVLLSIVVLLFGVSAVGRFRVFAVIAAMLVAGIIGASRVYLGVHWPTDIVAGWMLGVSWACLCTAILMRIHRRQ